MTPSDETLQPDELVAQLGWVRALARRLVSDPDVTDDVLQQVCLLALQQAPREARTGPRLRAWLAAVTRNLARHSARADIRRRRREQALRPAVASPATDDVAAHREALRQLVAALTSLEEPYYAVVVARYLDGRPVDEIAAQCGISQAAVRQRLSRARQQLRLRLQERLAEGRSRWLSAALPLAAVPASLKAASAPPSLAPFGGLLVAKSVPALAAIVVVVGIAITGAVLFLGSEERAGGAETVAMQALPATPAPAESRPDLPEAQPARLAALTPQTDGASSDEAAPKPVPDRLALPPVPARRAWDGLFQAADDLAFGTITQEGVVDLAFDLLAQLPPDAVPVVANGRATFDLLDSPGLGKVQFSMAVDGSADAGQAASQRNPFDIYAALETRPGAYTGNAADNAKSTSVTISVNSNRQGALQSVSALSQNMVPGSKDLWTQMNRAGQAVVIGGVFSITDDACTWFPLTVAAGGSAEKTRFFHGNGEPIDKTGKLAEPRTQLLYEVLIGQRERVPR